MSAGKHKFSNGSMLCDYCGYNMGFLLHKAEAERDALQKALSKVWESDQIGRMELYSKELSDAIDELEPLLPPTKE